jgi:hypothetical protein
MGQDVIKWLAQTAGVRHPVISTIIVMLLFGVAWNIFVSFVKATEQKATATPPSITQTTKDASCSNIVVTGGNAAVACPSENGKTDDTKRQKPSPQK